MSPRAARARPWMNLANFRLYNVATPVALLGIAWLSVSGCNVNPPPDAPHTEGSIFGTTSIPARALMVTAGQSVIPLESMQIHGAPYSAVHDAVTAVREAWTQELADIQGNIEANLAMLEATKQTLEVTEAEVAATHASLTPAEESIPENSRNRAQLLVKARAEKAKADEYFKEAYSGRIEPLKREIVDLNGEVRRQQQRLSETFRSLDGREFACLPRESSRVWVTNKDGKTTIALPDASPWVIWAENLRFVAAGSRSTTERYRWVLKLPDSLDNNGALTINQDNLFGLHSLLGGPITQPVITDGFSQEFSRQLD
jgi:hypothetical protein